MTEEKIYVGDYFCGPAHEPALCVRVPEGSNLSYYGISFVDGRPHIVGYYMAGLRRLSMQEAQKLWLLWRRTDLAHNRIKYFREYETAEKEYSGEQLAIFDKIAELGSCTYGQLAFSGDKLVRHMEVALVLTEAFCWGMIDVVTDDLVDDRKSRITLTPHGEAYRVEQNALNASV